MAFLANANFPLKLCGAHAQKRMVWQAGRNCCTRHLRSAIRFWLSADDGWTLRTRLYIWNGLFLQPYQFLIPAFDTTFHAAGVHALLRIWFMLFQWYFSYVLLHYTSSHSTLAWRTLAGMAFSSYSMPLCLTELFAFYYMPQHVQAYLLLMLYLPLLLLGFGTGFGTN